MTVTSELMASVSPVRYTVFELPGVGVSTTSYSRQPPVDVLLGSWGLDETPSYLCLPHRENHSVKYFRLKYFEFKQQSTLHSSAVHQSQMKPLASCARCKIVICITTISAANQSNICYYWSAYSRVICKALSCLEFN